mmetsp:Transcript_32877/g.61164  ORF Transcript_32877/g.61164 Transcript_32877/m.61164 type:complete len:121 (+) Transcript_32877:802-1164(+)
MKGSVAGARALLTPEIDRAQSLLVVIVDQSAAAEPAAIADDDDSEGEEELLVYERARIIVAHGMIRTWRWRRMHARGMRYAVSKNGLDGRCGQMASLGREMRALLLFLGAGLVEAMDGDV